MAVEREATPLGVLDRMFDPAWVASQLTPLGAEAMRNLPTSLLSPLGIAVLRELNAKPVKENRHG